MKPKLCGSRWTLFALIAAAYASVGADAQSFPPANCRYVGGVAAPGTVVCLEVGGRRELARCEMVLNNSSWRFLGLPCEDESKASAHPCLNIEQCLDHQRISVGPQRVQR